MTAISDDLIRSYYQGALAGLYAVELRRATGRRFGPDADARWKSFQGDLTAADRMNILIRDADTEWPGAFGARTVFALDGVAEDNAFGGAWPGLEPRIAEELWRSSTSADDVAQTLEGVAAAWKLRLESFDIGSVAPADKFVVSGPSATAALIQAFAAADGLDWSDQVIVVATPPAHRQLAALATALLNVTRRATVVSHDDDTSWTGNPRILISNDALPEDADRARVLQG